MSECDPVADLESFLMTAFLTRGNNKEYLTSVYKLCMLNLLSLLLNRWCGTPRVCEFENDYWPNGICARSICSRRKWSRFCESITELCARCGIGSCNTALHNTVTSVFDRCCFCCHVHCQWRRGRGRGGNFPPNFWLTEKCRKILFFSESYRPKHEKFSAENSNLGDI